MIDASSPLAAEQKFFDSLLGADLETLDRVLAGDFSLVDVMRGDVIAKASLMDAIGSGQLVFETLAPADSHVRLYGTTAVILGRTRMTGRFGGAPFTVESRYTHVLVRQDGTWRMVAAQGTPIGASSDAAGGAGG